jgi:hypothetical protein
MVAACTRCIGFRLDQSVADPGELSRGEGHRVPDPWEELADRHDFLEEVTRSLVGW